jgi:hypothetical protein
MMNGGRGLHNGELGVVKLQTCVMCLSRRAVLEYSTGVRHISRQLAVVGEGICTAAHSMVNAETGESKKIGQANHSKCSGLGYIYIYTLVLMPALCIYQR